MLEANFLPGKRETSVFGLTQWDKGQKLSLSFENMPESFQVHFSVRGSKEAVVVDAVRQNGTAVIDIPDEMLIYDGDIIAWIYFTGENYGETVGKVTLYVCPRARPKGYMEELVPSQQQIVENIIRDINSKLDYIKSNGTDAEYLPEYVKSESLSTAKRVLDCQNENTITFFAASDFHYDKNDYYTQKSIEHMSRAMKYIRSVCKVDFAMFLGDYIADRSDKAVSDAVEEFFSVNKAINDAAGDLPMLRAIGSEDLLSKAYYRNADYFDCKELFSLVSRWCSDVCMNTKDVYGGYFYRDFEKSKLRIICLNTSDFKLTEAVKPETVKAKISSAQLLWLCSALDLSDKERSTEWSSVIVSHYPINYYSNFGAVADVIKAYISGKSALMLDSEGKEISYDFSAGKNSAVLLALFNGALHNFKVNILEGTSLPVITIPNVCHGNNNYFASDEYSAEETLLYGEQATWNKTPMTAEETAFCIVTIDKNLGKLFIHSYGAGYDREISFDAVGEGNTPPEISPDDSDGDDEADSSVGGASGGITDADYTNLVPASTDKTGAVYNGTGYRNSLYIDESGEESYCDGFTVTGFIEAKNGDVVRISGGNWSLARGNTILVYDDNYSLIWSAALSGKEDSLSGLSYSGNIVVFNSIDVITGNLIDMTYIRISGNGDGETFIVTVNEEISTSDDSQQIPPVLDYVNIISYATGSNADSYNAGSGYMDGYALSADGSVNVAEPDSSFTHTGFIYCEKGALIRLKGYNWTPDTGNYIIIYDSGYTHCHTITLAGETNDLSNGISFSGGVMTFDTGAVTDVTLPETFFIRISTKASGANLVATYNEDLT